MPNRWLKLTVAYDGARYSGWQFQPDKPTIQGAVEAAWLEITQEALRVTAAGRTDAGVHALRQVVGFRTETLLSTETLLRALNAVLPNDVAVLSVEEAHEGFHATYEAIGKRYRYQIHNGRVPSVFERNYCWHFPHLLDATAMHRAGQVLVGRHDFSSFETAGSERPDSIRTITELTVLRGTVELADRVTIEVAGDGFLYNMVRTIVGTLVEIGRGTRDEAWISEVLSACDRRRAGQTAPPQGLFLVSVEYS